MTKKGDSSIRELDGMLKELFKYVDKQLFGNTYQEGIVSNSGLIFGIIIMQLLRIQGLSI
ncbi:MAG: hypothetical protein AB8V23_02545 [Candidatus Midichloria sp.]